MILTKVRLADVVETDRARLRPEKGKSEGSARKGADNRLLQKHLDFVLCDSATTRPLLVIELDDRSHDSARARERDSAKDAILGAAGLPVLRVPARRVYTPAEVARRVTDALAGLS